MLLLFVGLVFFFFFSSRRRHTRLVSDWSSDVCSSDLPRHHAQGWAPQVHVLAAPNLEHGVAGDDVFFKGGNCDGRLDRGTRNVAFAKRDFLIHYREDAPGVRINRDDRSVVAAKSGNRGGANNGIIVRTIVGAGRIRKRRDSSIARGGLMSVSAPNRRSRTWRRGQRQGEDC